MPRRLIYKVSDIYRLRGDSWEWNYGLRAWANTSGLVSARVLSALAEAKMPEPEMQIDGSLYRPMDVIVAQHRALDNLSLPSDSVELLCSMCAWYWSDSGWNSFVRQYEGLPDVTEDYYLVHDARRDGARLFPLSYSHKPVDNYGNKSSTSQVQAPVFRYKSADLRSARKTG